MQLMLGAALRASQGGADAAALRPEQALSKCHRSLSASDWKKWKW